MTSFYSILLVLILHHSLIVGVLLATTAPAHQGADTSEKDFETGKKIIGSSVVTSVSVILNGNEPQFTDAVGKPIPKPQVPLQVASPINLLNPDRYEFYTFDDNGELVKRLMTLKEIQSIVANGDGDSTSILNNMPVNDRDPEKNVQDIVASVQNVLTKEVEGKKNATKINYTNNGNNHGGEQLILDTPDVSSSWSMILPAIFGNTGGEIFPQQKPQQVVMTPDSDVLEHSTKFSKPTSSPSLPTTYKPMRTKTPSTLAVRRKTTISTKRPSVPITSTPSQLTSSTSMKKPTEYPHKIFVNNQEIVKPLFNRVETTTRRKTTDTARISTTKGTTLKPKISSSTEAKITTFASSPAISSTSSTSSTTVSTSSANVNQSNQPPYMTTLQEGDATTLSLPHIIASLKEPQLIPMKNVSIQEGNTHKHNVTFESSKPGIQATTNIVEDEATTLSVHNILSSLTQEEEDLNTKISFDQILESLKADNMSNSKKDSQNKFNTETQSTAKPLNRIKNPISKPASFDTSSVQPIHYHHSQVLTSESFKKPATPDKSEQPLSLSGVMSTKATTQTTTAKDTRYSEQPIVSENVHSSEDEFIAFTEVATISAENFSKNSTPPSNSNIVGNGYKTKVEDSLNVVKYEPLYVEIKDPILTEIPTTMPSTEYDNKHSIKMGDEYKDSSSSEILTTPTMMDDSSNDSISNDEAPFTELVTNINDYMMESGTELSREEDTEYPGTNNNRNQWSSSTSSISSTNGVSSSADMKENMNLANNSNNGSQIVDIVDKFIANNLKNPPQYVEIASSTNANTHDELPHHHHQMSDIRLGLEQALNMSNLENKVATTTPMLEDPLSSFVAITSPSALESDFDLDNKGAPGSTAGTDTMEIFTTEMDNSDETEIESLLSDVLNQITNAPSSTNLPLSTNKNRNEIKLQNNNPSEISNRLSNVAQLTSDFMISPSSVVSSSSLKPSVEFENKQIFGVDKLEPVSIKKEQYEMDSSNIKNNIKSNGKDKNNQSLSKEQIKKENYHNIKGQHEHQRPVGYAPLGTILSPTKKHVITTSTPLLTTPRSTTTSTGMLITTVSPLQSTTVQDYKNSFFDSVETTTFLWPQDTETPNENIAFDSTANKDDKNSNTEIVNRNGNTEKYYISTTGQPFENNPTEAIREHFTTQENAPIEDNFNEKRYTLIASTTIRDKLKDSQSNNDFELEKASGLIEDSESHTDETLDDSTEMEMEDTENNFSASTIKYTTAIPEIITRKTTQKPVKGVDKLKPNPFVNTGKVTEPEHDYVKLGEIPSSLSPEEFKKTTTAPSEIIPLVLNSRPVKTTIASYTTPGTPRNTAASFLPVRLSTTQKTFSANTLKPVHYFKQPSLTEQKLIQFNPQQRPVNRPPALSNLKVTQISQATRAPVKLEPTSDKQMGLEASTMDLQEDIQEFARLCNELAFNYWKSITSEKISSARSLILSPFALTSMLSMVFLGARGGTSGEMNEILKLDDMVTFNPHLVFKNITESVERTKDSQIASSAFVREIFSDRLNGKVLQFFKEKVLQIYSGHVEEVNFNVVNDIIRRRTNLLIKRHTMGKVMEYLRTNSVWVNGPLATVSANLFQTDCSKGSTLERDGEMFFQVHPSIRQRRLVPIPAVVWRTGFTAGYDPELDATAVAFGSTFETVSTIFVMPGQHGLAAPGDNLERLENALVETGIPKNSWSRLLTSLMERPGLEVQIPRFSHRSFVNASMGLQKMGLKALFNSENADLRGLTGSSNRDVFLSDMIQINTFSTCAEEKITDHHHVEMYPAPPLRKRNADVDDHLLQEADFVQPIDFGSIVHDSAFIARGFYDDLLDPKYLELPLPLRPRQARVPDSPRLRFDKPFLYFVRHNPTGMILFMGRFNPRLLP